jgi:hypothetical protein
VRVTALVRVPLDGTAATSASVPIEVDGPGIAALPQGQVAFVGRDLHDRGALARVGRSGSLVTLPIAARSVSAGGGLVALVDDTGVRLGTLAELDRGVLPVRLLPLEEGAGIGAVAISADGAWIAVVRLDGGDAARVELLHRTGEAWAGAGDIELDPRDGTAIPAWLP